MKGKAENERAFERVFQALYSPLCFFAASIIRDDVEAEDVVQQVFISLWEKNPELEWSMELKPFLYRSVRNAALNHIRQEEVRRRFYAFLEEQQTEYEDEGEWEEREKMYQKLDEAIDDMENGRVQVDFLEPQRAVTPGQAVVLYRGEYVAGGGIILGPALEL